MGSLVQRPFSVCLFLSISWCFGGEFDIAKAPAPLYRDPVYDGAADPAVVFDTARRFSFFISIHSIELIKSQHFHNSRK